MKSITYFNAMDYEQEITKAHDLIADGKKEQADQLLHSVKSSLREKINQQPQDPENHYLMAQALLAQEEPKQALVELDAALTKQPGHQESLWLICSILLHDLNQPESAKKILEQRLCKLNPENQAYQQALRLAKSLTSI